MNLVSFCNHTTIKKIILLLFHFLYLFKSSIPLILIPLLFLLPFLSQAQILKTDRPVNPSDTVSGLKGTAIASFDLQNRSSFIGTENIYKVFSMDFDLDHISGKHEYIMINHFNYKSATGATALSSGYVHLRARYFRLNRVSPEFFAQFQYDNARNMDFRQLEGGGLRFNIILNDKLDIHAGTGAMYEYERWTDQEDLEIRKRLAKMSSYLVIEWQISQQLRFNFINYWQNGYDKAIDNFRNRLSGDVVLNLKINSRFSLNNQFVYLYEDQPVIPIKKLVYQYKTGLAISF